MKIQKLTYMAAGALVMLIAFVLYYQGSGQLFQGALLPQTTTPLTNMSDSLDSKVRSLETRMTALEADYNKFKTGTMNYLNNYLTVTLCTLLSQNGSSVSESDCKVIAQAAITKAYQ